jgi:hypothetical protein
MSSSSIASDALTTQNTHTKTKEKEKNKTKKRTKRSKKSQIKGTE